MEEALICVIHYNLQEDYFKVSKSVLGESLFCILKIKLK